MESAQYLLSVFLMGLLPVFSSPAPQVTTLAALPLPPPALAAGKEFPSQKLSQSLSASGVAILDLQSGQELYVRNANRRRPMGSLTKIMTAVIIVESHFMDEVVTIPADIGETEGTTARLPPGQHFTVGDLLSALLIPSGNDAAEALARFHSGSNAAFVELMNDRATMLGLENTSFANPSGLDSSQQWSTPRDMAWLAAFALRKPEIRSRMSTQHVTIRSTEGQTIALDHTHALLGNGVTAGKTGTTPAARQCLLSVVTENGREYVVVLLGSQERYVDMRTVLRILSALFA